MEYLQLRFVILLLTLEIGSTLVLAQEPALNDYIGSSLNFYVPRSSDNAECKAHSELYYNEAIAKTKWAQQMYDSSAKVPGVGLLYGSVYDLGQYDECVETSTAGLPFEPRYCLLDVRMNLTEQYSIKTKRLFEMKSNEINLNIPEINSSSRSIFDELYALLVELKKILEGLLPSTSTETTTTTLDPLQVEINAAKIAIDEFQLERNKSLQLQDNFSSEVQPSLMDFYNNGARKLSVVTGTTNNLGICNTFLNITYRWLNDFVSMISSFPIMYFTMFSAAMKSYGEPVTSELNITIYSNTTDLCKIQQLTNKLNQYTLFLKTNNILVETEINSFLNNNNSLNNYTDIIIKFALCFCPTNSTTSTRSDFAFKDKEFMTDFEKNSRKVNITKVINTNTYETKFLDPLVDAANMSMIQLLSQKANADYAISKYMESKNYTLLDYDRIKNEINQYSSNANIGSMCYDFAEFTNIILNHETIDVFNKLDQTFSHYMYFDVDVERMKIDLDNAIIQNDTCKIKSLLDITEITNMFFDLILSTYRNYYAIMVYKHNFSWNSWNSGSIDALLPVLKCICSYDTHTTTTPSPI